MIFFIPFSNDCFKHVKFGVYTAHFSAENMYAEFFQFKGHCCIKCSTDFILKDKLSYNLVEDTHQQSVKYVSLLLYFLSVVQFENNLGTMFSLVSLYPSLTSSISADWCGTFDNSCFFLKYSDLLFNNNFNMNLHLQY